MNREAKIILALTGGSHLSVHAFMLTFPSLFLVIQQEFAVGLDTLGFMATAAAFMFGLGAIPAGWLEGRLGGRRLLLLYQTGTLVAGLMVSLAGSVTTLLGGLILLGLFASIYHPAGLTLISRRVPGLSRGMAIHGIFGSAGSALGPILATTIATLLSWRSAYAALALFNGLLALITLSLIPPARKQSPPTTEANQVVRTNKPALLYYYSTAVLMGFAYAGFSTFLPAHFALHTNHLLVTLSPTLKAGLFTSLVFGAGILGQYLGGILGDRYHRPTLLVWVVALNLPLFFLMGFTSNLSLVALGLLLGIVHFNFQPVGNSLVSEFTHSRVRGLGYGIGFFLSFGVGSLAAALSGIIAERVGTALVFPTLGIILLPAVLTSMLVKRRA